VCFVPAGEERQALGDLTGTILGFVKRVVNMATSGHNVTMRQVGIAELKSRLSEYLRAVRRGETISVLDRETPVAQIVPVRPRSALRIRKPAPGTPAPNRVQLPKPAALKLDVVELLMEERQGHR
jgi:prevent-host-death family protein